MFHLKASQYGITNCLNLLICKRQFILNEWLPYNIEIAKLKCREYLESNINCILVEFSDGFAIYLDAEVVALVN